MPKLPPLGYFIFLRYGIDMTYAGKNVLIFGLGLQGGGIATTEFFHAHGANITITDRKTKSELQSSIDVLKRKNIPAKYTLDEHTHEDIDRADIVVLNPDVPPDAPMIRYAREKNKIITNEAIVFFETFNREKIAITGTKGKTTTVNWTHHLLAQKNKNAFIVGNSSISPFLNINHFKKAGPAVIELPSFQLELFSHSVPAPHIAAITNIDVDHLNRHKTMEKYIEAKCNIFVSQRSTDFLILNADNARTKTILRYKPAASVLSLSMNQEVNRGLYVRNGTLHEKTDSTDETIGDISEMIKTYGTHNAYNFLFAAQIARLHDMSWNIIMQSAETLPTIPFRQEIIFQKDNLAIVNDTTGSVPAGAIPGIERFFDTELVLIAGGTDKELNFKDWANVVSKRVKPENLFLLSGSATDKMISELEKISYSLKKKQVYDDFDTLVSDAYDFSFEHAQSKQTTLLFSPASASFEKFKNEFDRGERFNAIVKTVLRKNGL